MNILFITSTRIGDAVLTTGILSYLVETHPAAKITIACGPLPAPLFEHVPGLEKLIVLHKQTYSRHWFHLWRQCVSQTWDMVIDLRGTATSYLLFAKKRYIWKTPSFYGHRVEQFSKLVKINPPYSPKLWFSDEQRRRAAILISGASTLAIAPAANWNGKQWPTEKFCELIKLFVAENPTIQIAVFAAPHEREIIESVIETIPTSQRIDLVKEEIDLPLVAACIERCQLFIGNDSGLMHIAAAVKTPTIGLFGPSDDKVYGPWGENNIVVRIPTTFKETTNQPGFSYKSKDCYMNSLSVETVLLALQNKWKDSP